MQNTNTWDLPFGSPAELELRSEWGSLALLPVEPGKQPRLELSHDSVESVDVHVEKVGHVVRVVLDPHRSFKWFGNWECRAAAYVPRDVHASVETNAGSVSVRDLDGCQLGIKANAGKIDLVKVRGLLHLSADAGSVTGREVGGYFDVETQAGSVRLEIVDLQPGEHRVRATMGSVRLELARGLDVCLETHTTLGSVRTQFPSRSSAPAKLVLSTEMGSIRVEEVSSPASTWPHPDAPTAPSPPEPPAPEPTDARPSATDPELERILKMVESGDLSAHEADELLRAMGRV
jgi:hypothetical protein